MDERWCSTCLGTGQGMPLTKVLTHPDEWPQRYTFGGYAACPGCKGKGRLKEVKGDGK